MPIRIRLTLWYTALLGAILIAFSTLLYLVLSFSLTVQVDRTLEDRARQIGAHIEDQALLVETGEILLPPLDAFASPATYVQIVRPDGSLVVASGNLSGQPFPYNKELLAATKEGVNLSKTIQFDDIPIRVYSLPIVIGPYPRVAGAVQVGQSFKTFESIMQIIAGFLVSGVIVGLFVAFGVGAFLAHKALKPMDNINQTAAKIVNGQDLKQRLPSPKTNDEIGQLTTTINSMLERLDNFFQAQIRLSADVSHELRTPLTTIRGNVDLLRRGAASDPGELKEALTVMDGELDRMSRIVADLLLLSQADAGLSLRMTAVELDTLILEVYRQARATANGVNVQLGHEDQAVILGDADRLKQLLINLLNNAIKHTPAGGEVTLSLYCDPEWVRVVVEDTGRGIAPTALPHIFERFYQADNGNHKGSGLGLSIAQWIAKAHGGQISVTSQVDVGSTFTLWLPKQAANLDTRPIRALAAV